MEGTGTRFAERARYGLGHRQATSRTSRTLVDFVFVASLLASGLFLLVWRAEMLPHVGVAGWILFGVEASTITWMVLTALLFSGRTDPDRVAPDPDPYMSLDVLIPVAGEPVEMVAATIAAAKAIEWPVNVVVCNDGWMAGKDNWKDIEVLCEQMGVFCLTRTTGVKGKAGNLNEAMKQIGAEAMLTIDADHQVRPDVVQEMMGWLRYEDVAFVSTPQEFHDSAGDPLNPTEPVFYRATQPSRDRHGLAFSTGNGVIYRREALVRIGGFSEWSIVEDLHTSIRLHSAGWTSVFHPRPVTIGVAPKTSAEYARQRLRWAGDSMRILRHDPPWRRRDLSLRGKIHYTHTLLAYLMTMVQVGFLLGPPAWIIGRQTLLADAGWLSQLIHIGPWLMALAAVLVRWAGFRGALHSMRLSAAFLPVVFWAAMAETLSPFTRRGTVTSKTNLPRFNGLVLAGLIWPLGLVATLVWGALDHRTGGSDLAMIWAAFMAVLTIGPLVRLSQGKLWPAVAQGGVVLLAVAIAGGSVATTRLGWEAPGGLYQSFETDPGRDGAVIEINELGTTVVVGPAIPAPADSGPTEEKDEPTTATPQQPSIQAPEPVRVSLAAADGIYVGFTSDGLPYDLGDVDRWANDVAEPQIVHWYQQWGSGDSRFRGDWLATVAEDGRIPMISWEAWAKPDGTFHMAEQELGRMANIAAGDHDEYIDEWAVAAAEYGDPILLRPFHEMNGFWYPWSVGVNGNTKEDYVAGWRHVVDRFRSAGADNVSFVWSINTLASFEEGQGVEEFYPGDDYVDWVATSGFNWDDYDSEWSSWVTADWVFGETYDVLASFDKPVMFAEIGTGTNGGDGAAWVTEAMDWFSTLPELGAIVWFDRGYDGRIDFLLEADQQAAFGEAVVAPDSRFQPEIESNEHPVDSLVAVDEPTTATQPLGAGETLGSNPVGAGG